MLVQTDIKLTYDLFKNIIKKCLQPIVKISVSEWADKYRVLSSESAAEPGKWHTDRAPYQREIMDSFTTPAIHKVVSKLASQTGKSDMLNNVLGRFAHIDPCPIMLVQPTIDMAQDYSKSRIAPMLRDTKVLKRMFHDVKSKDSDNTILSKLFPGGRLIMCGANSPTGLASRPIRILLCDEVDRFCKSAGTEGDPVALASKRTTTFWNYCVGLFSTPTLVGTSRIEAEYNSGTMEEWQHECPNCHEFSLIKYANLQIDYEESKKNDGSRLITIKSILYHCPHCGFGYDEQTMRNQPQKYVAKAPDAIKNGVRSFFVNAFSSPWIPWKTVVQEYLEAKGDPEMEKVVVNTRFGEVYEPKGEFADENIFLQRREDYEAECPQGVLLLTAAVDVQDNRLEYQVNGWGFGEECWGIKKGIIMGVPDEKRTWDELDFVLDKAYQHANGRKLLISRTFIDSGGHYTKNVYEYCYKNARKQRFAIKGMPGDGIPLIYKPGKAKEYNVFLMLLGVDSGKQQIMDRLAIDEKGPKYFHYPKDVVGETPKGFDDVYFKGLIAEKKVPRIERGRLVTRWVNIAPDKRNEPLDLSVYNLAAQQSINPNWERLQSVIDDSYANRKAESINKKPDRHQSYGGITQTIV